MGGVANLSNSGDCVRTDSIHRVRKACAKRLFLCSPISRKEYLKIWQCMRMCVIGNYSLHKRKDLSFKADVKTNRKTLNCYHYLWRITDILLQD